MMKMMEQTDGYVVAGAFEDDPALMNQEQYYSVRLAHTVYPDCTTVVKEYFGTLEQIRQLIYLLPARSGPGNITRLPFRLWIASISATWLLSTMWPDARSVC